MVLVSCPVGTSQNLTVWSELPEASRCPSALNATPVTQPEWALRVRSSTNSGTGGLARRGIVARSEEHTSELQSLTNLVCRLLLEKKNKNTLSLPYNSSR